MRGVPIRGEPVVVSEPVPDQAPTAIPRSPSFVLPVGEEDVLRLDVPVDDPRGREGRRGRRPRLDDDRHELVGGEAGGLAGRGEAGRERSTLAQLHDEEGVPTRGRIARLDVEDGDDVGVVDGGERAGFAVEPFRDERIGPRGRAGAA